MRVVLVEPALAEAQSVAGLLKARHHDVTVFADGQAALAYLKNHSDIGALITSDEPLSMSGIELCWEARLVATTQRPIYVMMRSAADDDGKLSEALDSGADDVLRKPAVAEELYARLRAAERFASMQRELVRLATTDSLTGMYNRRAFFENAAELCSRAQSGYALSAIMIDIDHFKKINDAHGHDVGDDAICAVAREAMLERAIIGRLGGEEFAMLLDRALPEALALAERLRLQMEAIQIGVEGAPVKLTCSFGVSQWETGHTVDRLLKRADMALYEAKLNGRNRVMAAGDPPLTYSEAGRVVRSGRRTA